MNISSIISGDFDQAVYIKLGDTRYYFKSLHIPSNKIKNLHIFEWNHINQNNYNIIEVDKMQLLFNNYINRMI